MQFHARIDFNPDVVDVSGVQGGLFSASIVSSGPGYVVIAHWYFFQGVPPVNDPNTVAFSVDFHGKSEGTTHLNYDLTDSVGNHRGWMWSGSVHNMVQVPVVMEYAVQPLCPNMQSDTKTEYGSTVTVAGPIYAIAGQPYYINLSAQTDAPIYQWSLYENSIFKDGQGFVWGNQFDKAVMFSQPTAGDYTYTFNYRGIMGAHGWPPYTDVSITVKVYQVPAFAGLSAELFQYHQNGDIKNAGLYNALLAKVTAAQNTVNTNAAINILHALTNQIEAQSGKGIKQTAAENLIQSINNLSYTLAPEKISTGQLFTVVLNKTDWSAATLEVQGTSTPYQPSSDDDERASVGESTQGRGLLCYKNTSGLDVVIQRNIEINNVTKELYYDSGTTGVIYHGTGPIGLATIFGALPSQPTGDYIAVWMDFSSPLTLSMSNVQLLSCAPREPEYKTDEGNDVTTSPSSGRPNPTPHDIKNREDWYKSQGVEPITPVMDATNTYNCHGWTFTCGKRWVDNSEVDKILTDNGYTKHKEGEAVHAFDVVVYRGPNNEALHTGVVTGVDANGKPTQVTSKWGDGKGYQHAPTTVSPNYYKPNNPDYKIEYWHTNRNNLNSKDRNTLSRKCGYLGIEAVALIFMIWLLRRRKTGSKRAA
jgi:hypothetical protein